jgi:hypothetical protein
MLTQRPESLLCVWLDPLLLILVEPDHDATPVIIRAFNQVFVRHIKPGHLQQIMCQSAAQSLRRTGSSWQMGWRRRI